MDNVSYKPKILITGFGCAWFIMAKTRLKLYSDVFCQKLKLM